MRSAKLFVPAILVAALMAKGQTPTPTVEVLSAETTRWTTHYNDPGSAGTTETNCTTTSDGSSTNCSSSTTGARPASSTPINHVQVDVMIRMPDGNQVKAQCHYPPIRADCVKPEPGIYRAQIDKHNLKLLFETEGRPDYNKDGTLKKAGKLKQSWVKFSFEDK